MASHSNDTAGSSTAGAEAQLGFPTEFTVNLVPHARQMKRSLDEALSGTEYRWYNVLDYGLNFNALRMSDRLNMLSVWPQARLIRIPPSATTPIGTTAPTDTQASADTQPAMPPQTAQTVQPSLNQDAEQAQTITEDLVNLAVSDKQNPSSVDRPSDTSAVSPTPFEEPSTTNLPTAYNLRPRQKKSTKSKTGARSPDPVVQIRYPDFLILSTILQRVNAVLYIESAHSIWEIKAPYYRGPGFDSVKQLKGAQTLFRTPKVLKQLIEQAQCTFAAYKHQEIMNVFLCVGYWVKKCTMRRGTLPPKDFDWGGARADDYMRFISAPEEFFCLLNDKKTDYSDQFKKHWHTASKDVKDASALTVPQ